MAMRSKRGLWVLSLWALMMGIGVAQPPLLVLTNGDVNGDNLVDDTDLLAVIFRMGDSCPQGCAEDLNGDLTVDDADLLIVNFHMGAQGAPAFAGQVSTPQGAFRASLRLQLGDWVGAAQSVKVQLKPVGAENNASVPIFEWTFSVGGAETEVELTNLPAGVYTVRAFPVESGRWLRGEGTIITEVPWIFAAPTGANKVTVYWDGVPGATGYRVRWGMQSGVYPNASPLLAADARRHTVEGLVSEQAYYFVVEAEYNGVLGAPSEEDSAVPHEGAIPWDSENTQLITQQVRLLTNNWADIGLIDCIAPDGLIVTDFGVNSPSTFFDRAEQCIVLPSWGLQIPLLKNSEALENTRTGPYRRVKTRSGFIGARGNFWVPSTLAPRPPYLQIHIARASTVDTPCIYFGFSTPQVDVEGGLMYHPEWRYPPEWQGSRYNRWQAYLKVDDGRPRREQQIALTDILNQRGHILDTLSGGCEVTIERIVFPKARMVALNVIPVDPLLGETLFRRTIAGSCKIRREVSSVSFRRVHSIAQLEREIPDPNRGYSPTGSYVLNMGIGVNVIEGSLLDPPGQLAEIFPFWFDWTPQVTAQQGSFPAPATGVVSWTTFSPFSREMVSIVLPGGL